MLNQTQTMPLMDPMALKEWITLNVASAVTVFFNSMANEAMGIITGIGVLSLAFFNVMRGLKVYQEWQNSKQGD
jgi:hypothetical protein